MARRPPTRLDTVEAWWALIARMIPAVVGAFILIWSTVFDEHVPNLQWGVGVVCMVPAAITIVTALLAPYARREEGPRGRS